MTAGVEQPATQQGQKLAVGLGSARTTKAIIPFPHEASPRTPRRYRGNRQKAVLARLVSAMWLRRSRTAEGAARGPRPLTGVGATHRCPAVRATPSGYPTRHTLREGPKERPQTRKLTAGGCRGHPDVVRETAGLPSSRDGTAVSNDPTEESSPFRAGRTSSASAVLLLSRPRSSGRRRIVTMIRVRLRLARCGSSPTTRSRSPPRAGRRAVAVRAGRSPGGRGTRRRRRGR